MLQQLLHKIEHRPWPLPTGKWAYYQEWNDVLFLHWKIPVDELQKLVPTELTIDTINGEAWVSLVGFTMQKIRPRFLPSLSFVSDFHEINIRTYVVKNDRPGVYFLNIEAQKTLSAFLSRLLSGLPYEKTTMKRSSDQDERSYISENKRKQFALRTSFTIKDGIQVKSDVDKWLTERYCLYNIIDGKAVRYEIHHEQWPLRHVQINSLLLDYKISEIKLYNKPDLVHYSPGVTVLAWKKQVLQPYSENLR